MNNLLSLTSAQLNQAADLKDKIGALEKQLASILGGSSTISTPAPQKKFKISAAGRAKIAAAAKARWAKVKTAPATAKPAVKVPAKKTGMSAAAKAKLSAFAKARWAKLRAEGKKSL